jgi:hypothetical protein
VRMSAVIGTPLFHYEEDRMTLLCRASSNSLRRKQRNCHARRVVLAVAPLEGRVLKTVMPAVPTAGLHGSAAVQHMHNEEPQAPNAVGGTVEDDLRHAVS